MSNPVRRRAAAGNSAASDVPIDVDVGRGDSGGDSGDERTAIAASRGGRGKRSRSARGSEGGSGSDTSLLPGTIRVAHRRAPLSWRLGLLADVCAAIVSWTLLNEILVAVWFFPLNATDITGFEVAIGIVPFAGALLCFVPVREVADRHPGTMRLLSIVGLLSYYVANEKHSHERRVLMLCIGIVFDMLSIMPALFGERRRRDRMCWAYVIALLAVYTIRMRHASEYRVWTQLFYNVGACLMCLFAAFWNAIERTASVSSLEKVLRRRRKRRWAVSAAAWGTLLFLLQTFFSEHGIVARWCDLPPFDPPVPAGLVMLCALHAGVYMAGSADATEMWWLALAAGATVNFWFFSWFNQYWWFAPYVAFAFALILCVFAVSAFVWVSADFTATPYMGRSVLLALTVWLVEHLVCIWIVAYKFCPGGFLLRESQHVLFFVAGALVALQYRERRQDVMAMKTRGATDYNSGDESDRGDGGGRRVVAPPREVWSALLLLAVLVGAPATWHRMRRNVHFNEPARVTPMYSDERTISSLIWAIHFAYDNFGRNSFSQVRDYLRENEIKVVGLLESDLSRSFFGNNDIVEYLGDELNMYADFGPSTAENTFGCALLSVYPIVRVNHVILPSPDGELACLIDASLNVSGTNVNVLVTHFGNTEEALDRRMQSEALARLVREQQEEPIILLSYLTTRPRQANYMTIVDSGLVDAGNPDGDAKQKELYWRRYCEYVMYRDLELIRYDSISEGNISDTEGQLGVFRLKEKVEGDSVPLHAKLDPIAAE